MIKKSAQGFTLVELLVVMAIMVVLAIVAFIVINPIEFTKQSRDTKRLTEVAQLQQAINVAVQQATGSGTAALLCSGTTAPCSGQSSSGGRSNSGSGWVKVDLSAQSVSVPTLPVDPSNTAALHYTYCSDGNAWELATVLESVKYAIPQMGSDGGVDPNLYEVGSSVALIKIASGATCTY